MSPPVHATVDTPLPRRRGAGGFSDRAAVALGCAASLGAWIALPGLLIPGIVGVAVAMVLRRPVVLVVAVALVASALGARATKGLVIAAGTWHGTVEVLHVATSPLVGVHAEVRAGGHHFDLVPPASHTRMLTRAEPGDRLGVSGRISPLDPHTERNRGSHVAARLHADQIEPGPAPYWPWRFADVVRRGIRTLGRPLPASQRALFNGFVVGDATGQSPLQQADFRASGLTHLLVASGENVAFVLILMAPLLTRIGLRARWFVAAFVLLAYALITGLEPSVLRAATMAGVAMTAAGLGRPVRSWRSLGIAVTVLVVADPFLTHSVAFGLSVGASAGIIALAQPMVGLLSGPLWVRRTLAVTIAAQIGVAPFLLGFPGGLPVATLPANLLAAVPAGLVMVLGIPALAITATRLPGTRVGVWVPRLLLGWVDRVAGFTAALQLGFLGPLAVVVSVTGVGVALIAARRRHRWLRRSACALALLAVVSPMFVVPRGTLTPAAGLVVLHRGDTTVVVLTDTVPTTSLLTGLSLAKVTRADLVVVPHGDAGDARMLEAIGHRCVVRAVLAPRDMRGGRWPMTVARKGEHIRVGGARIMVIATIPELSVHVLASRGSEAPSG